MEGSPRTWTNPGWGQQLCIVRTYVPAWMRSEWFNHIGIQTLVYGGVLLAYPMFDLTLAVVFRDISLTDAGIRLQSNGGKALVLCLGGGALLALFLRFLRSRGIEVEEDSLPQAEVFSAGLYITSYGFVNGMHPFFSWAQIQRIKATRKRDRINLTLILLHHTKPAELSIDTHTAAQIVAILDAQNIRNNPLSDALLGVHTASVTNTP